MKTNTQPGAAVSAHTALPWSEGCFYDRYDSAWEADINGPEGHNGPAYAFGDTREQCEANAELICRAVNNHDRLVAVLEHVVRVLNSADSNHADFLDSGADSLEMLFSIENEVCSIAASLSRPATATPGSAATDAAKGGAEAE